MEIYIIIHVLVFLTLIFELAPLKVKKSIIIGWCIFFTLFGGLRWRIGGDWDQYYDHFVFSSWSNIFNYDRYGNGEETLEPGFVFFNVLIKTIFGKFYIYNLIVVGFIQFTYYKFCNYFFPKNPLFCYCFLMVAVANYFPVRAGFSVGISYWCWKFIKEQKLIPFLIVIFFASIIHNKSIVLLPCYWLGKVRLKSLWLLILYPIIAIASYKLQDWFTILSLSFGGSIAEKAYKFSQVETEGFAGASYFGWVLNYFFLCIYLYIRKKEKLFSNNWYNVLLNSVMIYNAIFMIFSNGMGDLARLSTNFFPVQCILLLKSVLYFAKSKNHLISCLAIFFFLSYYIYKLPSNWNGYFFKDACVPYKTIFDYNLR
ncbi:MAG TPA: hypothetical protein DCS83_08065 [Prevotella sp.]|jgi:hypothetical protein|nr:EpsG family protein [uncultured Prevotella sp.]HAT62478.1 hypothetical protein [Prevotella sp.]